MNIYVLRIEFPAAAKNNWIKNRGRRLNNLTSVIHYSLGVSTNYSLLFSCSCRLFIIGNRLRVLSYLLFHRHSCVIYGLETVVSVLFSNTRTRFTVQ